MLRRWSDDGSSPLTAVGHRCPPLTGGLVVAPMTAGRPCGTTQVVTCGILMIKCQVAGMRYCSYEVAENFRWQYEVAIDGQLGDDTCLKRVIRGFQACVSPR
ncbi:hypothetical protein Tco_1281133 [Tanacetum coccineum]